MLNKSSFSLCVLYLVFAARKWKGESQHFRPIKKPAQAVIVSCFNASSLQIGSGLAAYGGTARAAIEMNTEDCVNDEEAKRPKLLPSYYRYTLSILSK